MKVRVNERSLSTKLDRIETIFEEKTKQRLKGIASDLSDVTPVDTGAYAESFSVGSKTRSRTSRNRPRNQSLADYRGKAKAIMYSDIEALDLQANLRVAFRNRAPHAKYIEGVYQVFGRAKDRNR